MSARKKVKIQALGAATGGGGGAAYSIGANNTWAKKPRSKQHIVRVEVNYGDWFWERYSPNHIYVACSGRSWPEKSHAVRAAKAEAALTGARLVIDGEEVNV